MSDLEKYERSSAAEAASTLLRALGWRSGGLASAAFEIVADRDRLQRELEIARGAMNAQDNRERAAGERCGIIYAEHGCDWPDAAAEKLLVLQRELDAAREEASEAKMDSANYRGKCGACGTANCDMLTDSYCAECSRDTYKAALERVEWVEDPSDNEPWCPWCGSKRKDGHWKDCERQRLLTPPAKESEPTKETT